VFPYKATDAGVVRMCFVGAVGLFALCQQAFDWCIVKEGNGDIGNLIL
jgi:hypothetical protein